MGIGQWLATGALGAALGASGCSGSPASAPAPDPAVARAIGTLETALVHPDPARRRVAAETLGAFGAPAAAPLLRSLGKERDPNVRYDVVVSVGRVDGPEAPARLGAVAGDEAEAVGVRLAAVGGLGAIGGETSARALASVAPEAGPVGRSARLALGLVGGPVAHQFFLSESSRGGLDTAVRRELVAGLTRVADSSDVAAIRSFLGDPDPAVRRSAAAALGRLGAGDYRAELESLRADPDPGVRRVAAVALYRIATGH
ncbi:MAG: HEAT repeat domain-containing protein [Planctomycetales bacterium]|nr:HEAT repeat domain-containing protein [Planctomycetales bacterium]